MNSSYLVNLNPEQRCAVEYGGPNYADAGPLLIIAGAGTGKTNTLAHRVANLIVNGIDPRRILLLTFSRRAATEMIRRVERITASALGQNAGVMTGALTWSGTFHAVGARLLREHAHRIGLSPSFTIHDREDSADLLNLVRHDLGFSNTKKRFPMKGTCLSIYSRVVNAESPLEDVLGSSFPWCVTWETELRQLFAAYVEAKQRQNVLDYDDLLLCWVQMMTEPAIGADVAERFDHVLVDEYQDTNRLQASILLALKPNGKGLTLVGDDAQSIYSFRAATVRNILDFPGHFSPRAEIATLERNYRSTRPILAAANAVMDLAEERFTKNLWSERASAERPRLVSVRDEADQARYVAEKILENRERGILLKTQAVLFRASHHSAPLEIELTRRSIPFVKFGGLKFLEAAHIKDVLAFLRWAENARDRVAGFRVIQLLPGAGPATAARILDRVARPNPRIERWQPGGNWVVSAANFGSERELSGRRCSRIAAALVGRTEASSRFSASCRFLRKACPPTMFSWPRTKARFLHPFCRTGPRKLFTQDQTGKILYVANENDNTVTIIDLERRDIEHIDHISDEMRAVVESEWPELAHKLPPQKPQG